MKSIIIDSSSLILLTKADLTEILIREFEVFIPEKVYEECVNPASLKRYPDALAIQQWVLDGKLNVKKADLKKVTGLGYRMDAGEKEVLALGLEYPEALLLTDDGNAIRIAKFLKKRFSISPLIAVDLFKRGCISYERAKQSIEKLSIFGRYVPNLIADVFLMLEAAKEEKKEK